MKNFKFDANIQKKIKGDHHSTNGFLLTSEIWR